MSNSVLIVEDEVKIASLLADYITITEYDAHQIHDGSEVIDWVKANQPVAIFLDIMLPGKDGITLCREIRTFSNVPILMITAKVDEIDRLIGLELGADDYICKPFSPREVIARLKAVLRRTNASNVEPESNNLLLMNDNRISVTYLGKEVSLTLVEFQLLKPLAQTPGRIYSREQLMETMYSDHRIVNQRTIDSHIKKLRKKLRMVNNDEELIQSVYGAGYRITLP